MRATHLFLAASVIIASVLTGCTQTEAPPYPVIDSGVYAWNHERPYWLDEHRVMFVGYAGEQPKSRDEALRMTPSIYLWDTKLGDIELYRENARYLCVAGKFIRYAVPDRPSSDAAVRKIAAWYLGPFGAEKYEESPYSELTPRDWRFNEFTCTYQRVPKLALDADWIPLRPKDGYIYLGERAGPQAFTSAYAQLRRADGRSLDLPISDFSLSVADYLPGAGYLLSKVAPCGDRHQSNRICDLIWWIKPNGESEPVEIPNGPWAGGASIQYYPLAYGVLLVSSQVTSIYDVGDAGVYRLNNSESTKLVSGMVRSVGVSPNGCKAIFDHHRSPIIPRDELRHWFTWKFVNLCGV